MESVLFAALFAATPIASSAPANTATLDRRCFALMASLAEDEDPRARSLGRVAAHYFLGRIDAAEPGFDPETALEGAAPSEAERGVLLRSCGDAMQAGGLDFRTIGATLLPEERPAA